MADSVDKRESSISSNAPCFTSRRCSHRVRDTLVYSVERYINWTREMKEECP